MSSESRSVVMYPMMAENLFRTVFGDRYRGYASAFNDEKYFKDEFKKLINHFKKRVSNLLVSEKYLDYIIYQLEYLEKELRSYDLSSTQIKVAFVINFKIIATLLGYHFASGGKLEEPYFIPNLWSEDQGWNSLSEHYKHKEKLETKKAEIIQALLNEKYTLSEVCQLFDVSGHKLAQLMKKHGLKK